MFRQRCGGGGSDETERRIQFVDAAVGIDTGVRLRHAPAIHERGLAGVASFGCDRHLEIRRAALACGSHLYCIELRLAKRGLHLRLFHQGSADLFAKLDELDLAHRREAGAGRDEVTHDDVFLEAAQAIDLAQRGRFGEDAGGVLEGRGAR